MGWLCQLIVFFEARARAPATGTTRIMTGDYWLNRASQDAQINPDLALPVRVLSVIQTSDCHPAQWEGWTENDQLILVRFRYGQLWTGLTPDFKTTPITLFVTPYGRVDDGYLAFETLRTRTAGVVEWPS